MCHYKTCVKVLLQISFMKATFLARTFIDDKTVLSKLGCNCTVLLAYAFRTHQTWLESPSSLKKSKS